jgi:hypothetical protein
LLIGSQESVILTNLDSLSEESSFAQGQSSLIVMKRRRKLRAEKEIRNAKTINKTRGIKKAKIKTKTKLERKVKEPLKRLKLAFQTTLSITIQSMRNISQSSKMQNSAM